jgi:hypothetical protein
VLLIAPKAVYDLVSLTSWTFLEWMPDGRTPIADTGFPDARRPIAGTEALGTHARICDP